LASFHFTEATTTSWPFSAAAILATSVVLACRTVMFGRAATLDASRVSAVTLWPRASASSRTRLPMLPVAPISAMSVIVEFLS